MLLSIVIPCYNEESVISLTLDTLAQKLEQFNISDYEIVCVNDKSKDLTLTILEQYAKKDHRVKIVSLAANKGQQIAFYAGMCFSSGDAVILMDADLQDPPNCIPEMIQKWKEGYQVVYGRRLIRKGESFLKKITAFMFYRILNMLSDTNVPKDVGEFRLMDRSVVDVVINLEEHYKFNRGLVHWLGFNQTEVLFERPERVNGETKFGWKEMINLAKDGIFAFSYVPIKFLQIFGTVSLIISFLLFIYTLYSFFTNSAYPGWSSLMIIIIFFSSIIILGLGIIGEYIIRIHTEVIKRPLFVAERTSNLANKSLPNHISIFHSNRNQSLQ
ncbi:MAG: glycosyltransferase family 2 protein [Brevinemataceae bacterium]